LLDRDQVQEELQEAIGTAVTDYRSGFSWQRRQTQGRSTVSQQQQRMEDLVRRKVDVRRRVVELRQRLARLEAAAPQAPVATGALLQAQQEVLVALLRRQAVEAVALRSDALPRASLLLQAFHATSEVGDPWRGALLTLAEQSFRTAQRLVVQRQLAEAQRQYDALVTQVAEAQGSYTQAVQDVAVSEAQMAVIQKTVAEVHQQVIALQSQLADIDRRLRQKATAVLLEKGLLNEDEVGEMMRASAPTFTWPVYGKVSAGFSDQGYLRRFGVPHRAIDIVVPQGSAVAAASDGVVFLVRDGGQKGYSYVLIGHQSGYATLYGHLSSMVVSSGQEVRAGEIIAYSGGTPGTYGAGPMTTGAHLHFEVIKDGVHVSPFTVLP
jgi:murein DD-endopeptidase MepM/ murein hydrolase activator NlpD